jgi:acetoin utilization deacetylase AcuC-like enzyme
MSNLVYITHPVYLEHDAGYGHPERPDRLVAVNNAIETAQISNKIEKDTARPATEELISRVHDQKYILEVQEAFATGRRILDIGDTVISEKSVEAALFAAGACIQGIDILKTGDANRVFCAVRPPGHHAERDQARGFCIFNNIAVAARYAQDTGMAEKILIVDWDVHHGNGTQHAFEEDNTVFYYSMHQYPFFPGSGSSHEVGTGIGTGYTLNRPLPGGSGDSTYIAAFEKDLADIEKQFKADLVLISAGFDAHRDDPLAGMLISEEVYWKFTEMVSRYAWRYSQGKILSILEGGYNLTALGNSVIAHLDSMIKH